MRFGLERMRRLVSALGMPQHRFASIHVVGTNGKSSVATATAALLEAHGTRAGAYLSPHRARWAERIRIGGAEIEPAAHAAAVERVSQAVAVVERSLEPEDSVTQFEAGTAVAFVALAAAGVRVAAVEAGLGGRLDATNVLPSRVTALTSVGLDHTEWLGATEVAIAAEKLAVLRDHTKLVLGPVGGPVEELAREVAASRHCELVAVRDLAPGVAPALRAPFMRRNLAVALAATEAMLGPLDAATVAEVAAALELPGRAQVLAGEPPLVLDAAHNPEAARALAEALPAVAGGGPAIACLAVLADKDAAGMLAALAPRLAGAVCTEIPAELVARMARPGARPLPVSELAAAAGRAGLDRVAEERDPGAALALAREWAAGLGGVVLVTGSHHLLRHAADL